MKSPRAPRLEERRTAEFAAELLERAKAWIPSWSLEDEEPDFGRALMDIAARFSSEVAERLNDAGEKMRRGFLDWLAVKGEAARPARAPVVFKLADAATNAVLAEAPVRLQADASGTPVIFETEKDVRVVPGRLDIVVGADLGTDAFYLSPSGLSDLQTLEPVPTQWQLKSFAAAGATKLQLDPELGLTPGIILEADGAQYRVTQFENGLATIEPPLERELLTTVRISKVTTLSPFDGNARNWQEHALYLGDSELLNIEAEATIEVVGAKVLQTGISWEYWGKSDGSEEDSWQAMKLAPPLEQAKVSDAIVLKKPKGPIDQKEINTRSSRWIRGMTRNVESAEALLRVDSLKLRVNCIPRPVSCPPSDPSTPGPVAEAMANNTPLVLSEPFYPLGREPRQFDAFYLGSAEAFSKKSADASICFEMSDATCQAYGVVPTGVFANQILAGVGKDRALHLFRIDPTGTIRIYRGPLRPPLPAEGGTTPVDSPSVELNVRCRPVIWNGTTDPNDFYVAVASGGRIWTWREVASDPKLSGWKPHSVVPDLPLLPAQIEDIVVLKSVPDAPGAVLSNGRFWIFDGVNWTEPEPFNTPLRDYASLVPVYDSTGALTDSMLAVSVSNDLYRLETDGTESAVLAGLKVDNGKLPTPASTVPVDGIRPIAMDDGQLHVVAINKDRDEFVAVISGSAPQTVSLGADVKAIGTGITSADTPDGRQYSVGARKDPGSIFLTSWIPTFTTADPTTIFASPIPDADRNVQGTPLVVGTFVVVSGGRGDQFVTSFDAARRLKFTTKVIAEGVILPATAPFVVGDHISVLFKTAVPPRMEWTVAKAPSLRGTTDLIFMVDPSLGEWVEDEPRLLGYIDADSHTGTIYSTTDFDSASTPDADIVPGTILRIEVSALPIAFCEVDIVNVNNITVKNATPLPAAVGSLTYWKPTPSPATVVPAVEFDPSTDGNWDASILDTAHIHFPTAPMDPQLQPSSQRATAFGLVGNRPTIVAFGQRWTSAPPSLTAPTPFIIDAVLGAWQHQLRDTSSNPALSWEYWNGKGWWSLDITADATERLATTGAVQFKVPRDIAESDWSGKTNFWIRARLVGGDYGHEIVKVISKPGPSAGETQQTVERLTDGIKAPLVLSLHISYSICDEALPKFVLTQDSGSIRDQSDANGTRGAIVEAFVPLAVMLGQLQKAAESVTAHSPQDCPPECNCKNQTKSEEAPSSIATGRAIFVGLDATLSGAPVNVLFLVEEHEHTTHAPTIVEALAADRFVPIVVDDATRALGESGLLSMAFAVEPTRSELFGKTRTWLRLAPKIGSNSNTWMPSLRGAYLNAVWASATETLTRELLGSSQCEPGLTLRLARSPVLRDTLELRVKEPLGEEERKALREEDENLVLSKVEGLPGDWVLWKQVVDPGDELPGERVYALDEANGEIRFGDGLHGKIPPIGVDSIVAFRYSRTEPGPTGAITMPGNTIEERIALNLISPVETVESVTTADHAAGGAPPESDDRVLRFGFARLRHRQRAVSAKDIEDLALQSSPDIAQARAILRRGYVRMVVVMRGKDPRPNAAQIRELRRLLLAAAPVSLSANNALRIEQPKIRRLQIELLLRVNTLDQAGKLGREVKQRFIDFFNAATGGIDKDGWPLGLSPSQEDIAFALVDTPHLDGIGDVKLHAVSPEGDKLDWPPSLKPDEIVVLADDPVRIQFETAEVAV